MIDGLRREMETRGDVRVAQTFVDEPEDLQLARGESGGIRACRLTRTAHAERAKFLANDVDQIVVAELLENFDGALQQIDVATISQRERFIVRIAGRWPRRRSGIAC